MKLDLEQVKETFFRLSGEDPQAADGRGALCVQLCEESAAQAQRQVKRGMAGLEPYQAALESWAAAEAFYQLTLADEALTPESVSAGGVLLRQGERSRRARALALEKRRAAAPVLREEGFYFGRV